MRALRTLRPNDVLLAAAVLAGLIAVAWLGTPAPDAGRDTYASTDYRSGGYAAWFALMQREGAAPERFEHRPGELDARIGTLIAAAPLDSAGTDTREAPDRAALARYVAAGGQIIALGAGDAFAQRGDPGAGRRPEVGTASHRGGPLTGELAAKVGALAGLAPERFVLARGAAAGVLLADRGGPIVVLEPYGRGIVIYVSDAHLFDNALLARAGNARLAYLLAQPPPQRAVAFDETLHGALIGRTWWQTIDVPTRVALAGTVLAVLIALAGGALRLGPPIALRAKREPASDEFIAAIAALYERNHARRAAIACFAGGAVHARGAAAMELRALAERQSPTDRDVIASAALARAIREEA